MFIGKQARNSPWVRIHGYMYHLLGKAWFTQCGSGARGAAQRDGGVNRKVHGCEAQAQHMS